MSGPATLAAALAAAQARMGHAHLDGKNPHFRSRFATLKSVIDAVRPALTAEGIAYVQLTGWADGRVTVTTRLLYGDEVQESTVSARPQKDDPQSLGSAITYLRRYSLAAMCGIAADEDDDGHTASSPRGDSPPPTRSGTPSQAAQPPAGASTHHPSFTAHARRKFMAELGELGVKYADLAQRCEAAGWGRPSAWKPTQRASLLADLATHSGDLDAFVAAVQGGGE